MVRRTRLIILLLAISIFLISGCAEREEEKTENKIVIREGENTDMKNQNITETVKELLGCDERTAESIIKQCQLAGIEDISDIEKEDTVYTTLKLSTKESVDYYVFFGNGFFIEQIRKESIDGEQIYMAME